KGVSQLLASRIIPGGSGKDIATEVLDQIESFKITEKVKCVCSDTTSTNTGCNNGAVKIIEDRLGRRLIYLACRHHALEIIPKTLFENLIEKSSSPDIGKICKNFATEWEKLDQKNYTPATMANDTTCNAVLTQDAKLRITNCVFKSLQKEQVRADYEYFLELELIFIGETPPKGVHFRPPIALTSARFMGRIIYCLTIYMFAVSGQYTLDQKTLEAMRDFNLFIVTTYVEPWFTATVPSVAPRTDLNLLISIFKYESVSKTVADIAMKAWVNHLWYLAPHCIALSFFDRDVPVEVKVEMVKNLNIAPKEKVPPKRLKWPKTQKIAEDLTVASFVNSHTQEFFTLLNLDTSFLTAHPSEWHSHDSFSAALEIVEALVVVNDVAERAVKLTTDFNGILTRSEKCFQNILLVMHKTLQNDSKECLTLSHYSRKKEE
ncbi:tRNA uridine 5-carboxymethylaminomethyl modification enzyme 2, partial [Frankliniella fusca]